MGHPLVGQLGEPFGLGDDFLDGLGRARVLKVGEQSSLETLIFRLRLGGLARRGSLAGKQFDLVVQTFDQFSGVLGGRGFNNSDSVLEEFGLGHGVVFSLSPFDLGFGSPRLRVYYTTL